MNQNKLAYYTAYMYQDAYFKHLELLMQDTSSGADDFGKVCEEARRLTDLLFDGSGYEGAQRTHGSGTGQD